MYHVLLDKNVPVGIARYLSKHQVQTTSDMGWSRLTNGELLDAAENQGFEVLVTSDQSLRYQQNLFGRKIAIVALGSNIWPIVRAHAGAVAACVDAAEEGSYSFIEMLKPIKRRGLPEVP